jgi:membrane associated rhomboid family serine protease
MASHSKSDTSSSSQTSDARPSKWLNVGVVAAASALAGGLAAAWWYRKTLKKLRQSGENTQNPQFGIPADDPVDG